MKINSRHSSPSNSGHSAPRIKLVTLNDYKNLFASKYQLYLPTEEELQKIIKKELE